MSPSFLSNSVLVRHGNAFFEVNQQHYSHSFPLLSTASEAIGLLQGAKPDIPDWFVWSTIFIISYFAQQRLLRFLSSW